MIEDLSYPEMEKLVDEWIHNGRNRELVKRKIHNTDITFEQLAEEYKLSVTRTKVIVKEAKALLNRKLLDF